MKIYLEARPIGVAAYQPIDGTTIFSAGAITLFNINFTTVGTATIDFSDSPIPRRASDPSANAVATTSAAGTVTIFAPTAALVSVSSSGTAGKRRRSARCRL